MCITACSGIDSTSYWHSVVYQEIRYKSYVAYRVLSLSQSIVPLNGIFPDNSATWLKNVLIGILCKQIYDMRKKRTNNILFYTMSLITENILLVCPIWQWNILDWCYWFDVIQSRAWYCQIEHTRMFVLHVRSNVSKCVVDTNIVIWWINLSTVGFSVVFAFEWACCKTYDET